MTRTVLLRHDLPDGSWHYDWLVERPPASLGAGGTGDCSGLLTFRVADRPDDAAVWSFDAERLADHRPMYLEYEGEIGGGRGRVCRVADGEVERIEESPGLVRVRGRLGDRRAEFEGRTGSGGHWHFRVRALSGS